MIENDRRREQSEDMARHFATQWPENIEDMSLAETRQILRELQAHQIDLEMQNKKYHAIQKELDAERARYFDFYNLAPVGYCSISEQGLILEANLTTATLLGVARDALVNQPITRFIHKEYQDIYYLHRNRLFETGESQACDLRMVNNNGAQRWVHLTGNAARDAGGTPVCRVILSDITERKHREEERELTAHLILRLNTPGDIRECMSELTASLQGWSGCEAVGIRLSDGEDYPYYETRGFPSAFVKSEKHLCAYGPDGKILRDGTGNPVLECMCGNILCGRFDPAKPFFTAHGSFWSNSTSALLASTTEADRQARTRNRCNGMGYESVALIPLRTGDQVIGLLQFNDHRPDRFSPDLIAHLERMADGLAIALLQRQTDSELRENEETYRKLVESLPDIVMRFDRYGRHLFVSENVNNVVDLQAAQFTGKTHRDLGFPERQCRFWEEAIRGVFDSGTPFETEFTFDGKQGPSICNWRLIPECDTRGDVRSVLSISRDLTLHRRTEQNYRMLFNEMLDGFALHEIICNAAGNPVNYRFLAVNPAFERLTGLNAKDILGKTVLEILPGTESQWIETYGKVALTGEPVFFENYAADLKKYFEVTAFQPDFKQFACIFTDVTDRKQAEEEKARLEVQLRQAQKMEAIGSLAGGIAHDLNNILFPISGLSEMLLDEIPPDNPAHESLEQIHKSAKRGSDLVKQILAFSRQANPQKLPIRIQPILKEALKLARSIIPTNIDISSHIETNCGMVFADPTQIHQIAMNLLTNAYHAVEQTGGTIHVELKESAARSSAGNDDLPCQAMPGDSGVGRYVSITVSDTGTGIDHLLIDKIFEPYFTTKEPGKGTGLGLSVVHGIVKEHRGDIRVHSMIGKGTVFHVYLPLLEDGRDSKAATVSGTYPTGSEDILLIDDEEPIAHMEHMMLEKLGYQITVRTSSPDALDTFRADPLKFDLVISDRGMPNMTGEQLARELLSIRPDIPIILCTGFGNENDVQRAGAMGIKGFLMKPVAMGDLAATVRKVLDDACRQHAGSQKQLERS